jgi:IS30 family transposase
LPFSSTTFDVSKSRAVQICLPKKIASHSPWQKGGIENAIGRLRRQLPRKTDLNTLPAHRLAGFLDLYNNTPRKCLGFKTPNEVSFEHAVALQT